MGGKAGAYLSVDIASKASVLDTASHFYPSLIFEDKYGAYLSTVVVVSLSHNLIPSSKVYKEIG